MSTLTPLMQQYHEIKQKYPDALVLFQVGDFFELFYDDAKQAAAFLGIALTKRGKVDGEPIPLCGVPCHAFDHYLVKLVRGGFHVVLCEQSGVVEPGKLVERKVTQVFTPGTLTDEKLLDPRSAAFYAALCADDHTIVLFIGEVITGRCSISVTPRDRLSLVEAELARSAPRELLVSDVGDQRWCYDYAKQQGYAVNRLAPAMQDTVMAWIKTCTDAATYAVIQRSAVIMHACGIAYSYLARNAPDAIRHMRSIQLIPAERYLVLDAITQRNLELVAPLYEGDVRCTLWSVLDHAITAMGSRVVKRWLLYPLMDRTILLKRQDRIALLMHNAQLRTSVMQFLRVIGDIERVVGRIVMGRGQHTDYRLLRDALGAILQLMTVAHTTILGELLEQVVANRHAIQDIVTLLCDVLPEDSTRSWLIKSGYHAALDQLRTTSEMGERLLLNLEERERQATGIGSLKVRFNGVHGYAFEVTKAHRAAIPAHYTLVQSLVNKDRFSTPELRKLEYELHHAHEQVRVLEQELFEQVVQQVRSHARWLPDVAHEVALLDAHVSFALAALTYRYVRPIFSDESVLMLKDARHPVVELVLREQKDNQPFIANTVTLSERERTWIITGPNMGGKSTFLRQVALSVIMAQAGSFVPAAHAMVPLCDRIFTRIGSGDNVAGGKSTFFVEMEEVARICQEVTPRSLVIFDEVGRGTSTYDGMALAQAIVEYVHDQIKAWVLFATHYHEIARELQHKEGIGTYQVAVRTDARGEMVLLHTVCPGIAEGSFGLAVAYKAGVPSSVINRARVLLAQDRDMPVDNNISSEAPAVYQAAVRAESCMVHMLKTIEDINAISPRQAWDLLAQLHAMINLQAE